MPNSEYMTIGDAAEYLDMDRRQVRRLIERGQLTAETNPIDGRGRGAPEYLSATIKKSRRLDGPGRRP
jgi:excisionase family DNA binding protein